MSLPVFGSPRHRLKPGGSLQHMINNDRTFQLVLGLGD